MCHKVSRHVERRRSAETRQQAYSGTCLVRKGEPEADDERKDGSAVLRDDVAGGVPGIRGPSPPRRRQDAAEPAQERGALRLLDLLLRLRAEGDLAPHAQGRRRVDARGETLRRRVFLYFQAGALRVFPEYMRQLPLLRCNCSHWNATFQLAFKSFLFSFFISTRTFIGEAEGNAAYSKTIENACNSLK